MTRDRRFDRAKVGLIILLAALLAISFFKLYKSAYENTRNLQVDEDSHLYNTYYYKLFFIDRDFGSHEWGSFAFYDQPPLAKYVMGSILHLFNETVIEDAAGAKSWHRKAIADFWIPRMEDVRTNAGSDADMVARATRLIERGNSLVTELGPAGTPTRFTERDVVMGRLTVLTFEVLSAGILIVLVWHITNSLAIGLGSALLFVSSPVTIPVFQSVYTDSLWFFFVLTTLSGLLMLAKSVQKESAKRTLVYSTVAGMGLGLAISAKIIAVYMAAVAVIVAAVMLTLSLIRNKKRKDRSGLAVAKLSTLGVAVIATVSTCVVVALNPFLYHDTIGNFLKMFEHRQVIMEMQSMTQGPIVETLSQRLRALAHYGILSDYDRQGVLGLNLVIMYLCILLFGLWSMLKKSYGEIRKGEAGPYFVILVLSVVSYVFIGMTVHMEWERYFLSLLLCNIFWFAFGIDALARFCLERGHKN